MRFKLRAKIVIIIAALSAVAFAALSFALTNTFGNTIRSDLQNQARTFAQLATEPIGSAYVTFQSSGKLRISQQVKDFAEISPTVSNITIVDIDGNILFTLKDEPDPILDIVAVRDFEATEYTDNEGTLTQVTAPYFESTGAHRYSVLYNFDSDAVNNTISRTISGLIVAVLVGVAIIALTLNTAIETFIVRHIETLRKAANDISKGKHDTSLVLNNNDELGDLATALNSMARRLQDDIEKLKKLDEAKSKFMVIVTHNLHTPLAIIQDYVDFLMTQEEEDAVKEKLGIVRANTQRLQAMIEDTVLITSMEVGENPIKLRPTDMNAFFASIAKEMTTLANKKDLTAEVNIHQFQEKPFLSPVYIRSAIWNVIDNAIKFTSEGTVSLHVTLKDQMVEVKVTDTGTGIEDEAKESLFTSFHHGTDLYQFEYEGVGLGLYTTRLILENHGGDIKIDSEAGKGTTVTMHFPYVIDIDTAPEEFKKKIDMFALPRKRKDQGDDSK